MSDGEFSVWVFFPDDTHAPRYQIACEWAGLLLDGAPTTRELLGLDKSEAASNVVRLRGRAA